MKDFSKISGLMKQDWNRRIKHDYRFWMSDGYHSDEEMWQSGERDFAIITKDLSQTENKVLLELGCGVGRLLRPALNKFAKVIGVDVSEQALEKARNLLGCDGKLELHACSGVDLSFVPDQGVDVAISFAALTSMPVRVTANYLREVWRILRTDGVFRLQLYLGAEQEVPADDTLHLRCYKRECFERAALLAGFEVQLIEELVLPFQVSYQELGIEAVIIALRKKSSAPACVEELAEALLPGGERLVEAAAAGGNKPGTELEYWMALRYAEELAERGESEAARRALEYAESYCWTVAIDVSDLLGRIVSRIESAENSGLSGAVRSEVNGEFYQRNLRILKERFPEVHRRVTETGPAAAAIPLEIRQTEQGPVIYAGGQCLDHPEKPVSAAQAWIRREAPPAKLKDVDALMIYGFAGGYHVEAALADSGKSVTVIEPYPEVLGLALKSRDLSNCLSRLAALVLADQKLDTCTSLNSDLLVRPQSQAIAAEHCAATSSAFYGRRGFSSLHPKVAVVGPLQGGTLPIAGYCVRALAELKQRQRLYDMSGFAPGYHLFDNFIFEKFRQTAVQGHYVEMLSQLLLDSLAEKPADIVLCMAQAPISVRALLELKKRGVITVLWFVEDYLRFTYWKMVAPYFDFIFTIQKGACIEAIKAAGAGEVHYLPTACDPLVHAPRSLSAEERSRWGSEISFVGAGYHNRQQTFASLAGYPFKIWGTEWPQCRPFDRLVQEGGRRLTPEEYVKIFNASGINLNLHSSTERDGVDPSGDFVNPRTFELACAGAFQLVDQRSLLGELFESGSELVTFNSGRDLKDKIDYYSNHPAERQTIAARARQRALRDHTYVQRLQSMLSTIYSSRYEELRRREENNPWARMLKRAKPHSELHARCQAAFERGEEATLDGLVADIVTGNGKLSVTEQKLLFMHHVRKQIIRMTQEEAGGKS